MDGIRFVNWWDKATIKSLFVPGGVLAFSAWILIRILHLPVSSSTVHFLLYAVFLAGLALAWRFHSSRIFFALILLFLGQHAIEFFAGTGPVTVGPGRIALEAVAFLLPLNFIALSLMRERGISLAVIASPAGLLFVQSVFVAVICRPGETSAPGLIHASLFPTAWFHWSTVPQISLFLFIAAFAVMLLRFQLYRKPVESGLIWSLAMTLLALESGAIGPIPVAYVATACLILASSIIENSYVLAYHDELTSLPARRAFNESVLRLEGSYALAVVDIDHFKRFNDTYGHETGDEVLRMVATRLSQVTGGGQAYRIGGEEFCILFPAKSARQALEDLELLRQSIEASVFYLRRVPLGELQNPERRRPPRRKSVPRQSPQGETELSVTVSIGVAEPGSRTRDVEEVMRSADRALYRAKQSGRNRVELADTRRRALRPARRHIA